MKIPYLFPGICIGCDFRTSEQTSVCKYLCISCYALLQTDSSSSCARCRTEVSSVLCQDCIADSHLIGITSATSYKNPIAQTSIHELKYNSYLKCLAEPLGRILADALREQFSSLEKSSKWAVVPVPLHSSKLRERNFNQAQEIGKTVANLLEIGFIPDILSRVKRSKPQAHTASKSSRIKLEKRQIFQSRADENLQARYPYILLVDDVFTTGATMESCAKQLAEAGYEEIWGAVVAH